MAQKILLVDDSSIIRTQYRLVLQKAGYEVVEAWDAAQAASALKTLDIAFMLCDYNIPGVNGLDLIEAMRQQPRLAALPTAILSADVNPTLVARAKRAEVAGWLVKPCSADKLLELVAKCAGPA